MSKSWSHASYLLYIDAGQSEIHCKLYASYLLYIDAVQTWHIVI